jgi:nitrate/nitrite-specific signal transduction histidine kinase
MTAFSFSGQRTWASALAISGLLALAPPLSHANATGPSAATAISQALSLPSAINKSGRERMLSQRLGKAYAMQAFNIEPELTQKIRQHSEALFISQLDELKKTTPTPEIGKAVAALESAWNDYQKDLLLPLSKENAQRIYESGEQTLQRAHALTLLYEKQLNTAQAHLVNIAGRQRMLSQRMARAFYFSKWDIATNTAKDLQLARQEFVQGLKALIDAPQNTPAIRQELALAEQQWLFFQFAIDGGPDRDKHVATTSERILEQMNVVTEMYEKLSD